MVKKCLECKYFKKGDTDRYGRCALHVRSGLINTDDTCGDFTPIAGENDKLTNLSITALELRISRLEDMVQNISRLL